MGSAGTIIQWILELGPLVTSFFQMIINAFKKTPTPAPAPAPAPAVDGAPVAAEEAPAPAEALVGPSMGTVLAFVMHLMPFIMPLIEDGLALAKAEPGVALPQEVKAKAGEVAKLLSDLAQALTGLDALAPAVKVIQELADVLAALAA